eukprot:CAMPEP_0196781486 /NCGR_PEP_ID=MMETSP1104-20130614/9675_1 /TAXON_ID=33652 /ORGANISM="Cafeteria sp., Strain Caron Lab Isolate" /LENGTH=545 /DNA_ID=CAMNT_0042151719 /DNA_START=50 /DNA_END=1687 /DNA_ORIENTATION=+
MTDIKASAVKLESALASRHREDPLGLHANQTVLKVLAKFSPDGSETVQFSDYIVKINPRGRLQERVIMITDLAVYNLMPSNFGKCKRRIPLTSIESVTVGAGNQFVIHVPSEYDYRFVSNRVADVVDVIRTLFHKLTGTELRTVESALKDLKSICVNKKMGKSARAKAKEELDRQHAEATARGTGADGEAKEPEMMRMRSETRGWSRDETSVTMDDFELLKVLGRGSFGKVMLARLKRDTSGKLYAIKTLKKAAIIKRNQVEHTRAEREILEKIRHPFLMRLHYAFQTSSKLYLVMDYLTGGELFFHLKNARRFNEARARFYAAEIVLGLEHLHAQGIIYRDLKPENVLLDGDGHVCLTDFGLSKRIGPGQKAVTFCGTPEYLAPEIIRGDGHGKEVDWWSLGILLYEMMVGLPPFYSENVNLMYELIKRAELRFPSFLSSQARHLLTGLLERIPRNRLGYGPADAKSIKEHPFFEPIDWDALYHKSIEPPFRPNVKNAADAANFDKEFTSEEVVDSHVGSVAIHGASAAFSGFSYAPKPSPAGK